MNIANPANRHRAGIQPLCLMLFLFVISQSVLGGVTASLNRSTIQDGDTVTLLIESSDLESGGQPDLSVLERDFEVLGTSSSQQLQIINGRTSGKRRWQIELAPLHGGVTEVPAVPVGNASTRPLTLTVSDRPAPGAAAAAGEPVFLKAVIGPPDADLHVQQQLNLTLQLYFRESLVNGSFDGPDLDTALLERLGEDVRYTTRLNGDEYQVIERRYAVFPEESGELVIPEVVFTGHLRSGSRRGIPMPGMDSMLDDFMSGMPFGGSGKRIRVRSEPQSVTVQPRPADYSGKTWLPAAELTLHDSWADGPPEFRVGEPVTRTLTLEARGLEGSQLPALDFPPVDGVRMYPEQPVHENRTDGKWVYGSSKQSLAYVPSAGGKLIIPEIRVDWWDTGTQQQRTAILPAWEVNVSPGAAPASAPPSVPVTPPAAAQAAPAAAAGTPPEGDWRDAVLPYWPWLAGIVLLAAVARVLLRRAASRARHHANAAPGAVPASAAISGNRQQRHAALSALQRACSAHEPQAAARALLQLAAIEWPADPPRNLEALACRSAKGAGELRALERVLYAAGDKTWQGDELWKLFSNGIPAEQQQREAAEPALAPLYPDWNKQQPGP